MMSLGDIYLVVKELGGVKELRQMPFGVFPGLLGLISLISLISLIPPIITIP